jgi:hypothetical protein
MAQSIKDLGNYLNQQKEDIPKLNQIINGLEGLMQKVEQLEKQEPQNNVDVVQIKPINNPEVFPQIVTCDNLTSTEPFGFVIDKLKPGYDDGIFVIEQMDENTAELRINDSRSALERVFGALEDTLNNACYDYESLRGAKQIITKEAGLLEKENDIWIIKEKIKIELIKN